MYISTSERVRMVPIHAIAKKLGVQTCNAIVAAHHLTGADYTSKVGTKLSAIHANPQNYLLNFGRGKN